MRSTQSLRTLHSTSNAIRHSLDPSHRSHTLQSQSDMETVLDVHSVFCGYFSASTFVSLSAFSYCLIASGTNFFARQRAGARLRLLSRQRGRSAAGKDADEKPVLTINSGDIVTIETATHIDPAEVDQSGAVPASAVPEYVRAIYREVTDRGPALQIL